MFDPTTSDRSLADNPPSVIKDAHRARAKGRGAARHIPLNVLHVADSEDAADDDAKCPSAHGGSSAVGQRAARSYYKDTTSPAQAIRICFGTSCVLNGADECPTPRDRPWTSVSCLGRCDRGPVLMDERGRVHTRSPLDEEADATDGDDRPEDSSVMSSVIRTLPDIRCESPVAIVTRRIARGDYSSLATARSDGAYEALESARARPPRTIIELMEASGERGRGGAAFPTGTKWRRAADAAGDEKVIIANGDEGDPGSFIDRVLMEQDPHAVLEGLAIGAYAVGAHRAFVYIRSEYPEAQRRMRQAIAEAVAAGVFGPSGTDRTGVLDVAVVSGHGSYVCGEETAMLNAMEGRRGEVRLRPPYPTESGLFGRPTIVDNVETLVNVPWIVTHGADAYGALGTKASSGTKAICLNRGFARPGIVEVEFGRSLRDVVAVAAGGARDGSALDAILLGGPMGSIVGAEAWDVPVCYEAMRQAGVRLGHAGVVALPAHADVRALLIHWLRFMRDESCGKCAPCALGSRHGFDLASTGPEPLPLESLDALLLTISRTSLCAFGREMPKPIRELLSRSSDRFTSSLDRPPCPQQ